MQLESFKVNLIEFHQTKSPQLVLRTFSSLSDPEGIRTPDRLLRRQMLYPTELRDHSSVKKERQPSCLFFVGVAGFEPTTSCSQSRRDTGLRYTPKCSLASLKGCKYTSLFEFSRILLNLFLPIEQKYCENQRWHLSD